MDELKISGKVIDVLHEQSGESRNGPWRKRDFILETSGQYPKKVCVTQWGEQIDTQPIGNGDQVTVSVNIESREYNGRWYTDVKAWRISKDAPGDGREAPPPQEEPLGNIDDVDDDLPF